MKKVSFKCVKGNLTIYFFMLLTILLLTAPAFAEEGESKIFKRFSFGYNAFDGSTNSWNIGYGYKENVKIDSNISINSSSSTTTEEYYLGNYTSESKVTSFNIDIGFLKYLTPKKDFSFLYGAHIGYGFIDQSSKYDNNYIYYNNYIGVRDSYYNKSYSIVFDANIGIEYFLLKNLSLAGIYKLKYALSESESSTSTNYSSTSIVSSGILRIILSF